MTSCYGSSAITDELFDVIQQNITKALYLADGSAKQQYENLKENGYYSNIIAGNLSQQININSVQVQMLQPCSSCLSVI
jgi:hypothetical protein